jgi:hypothetical protein
MAVTVDSAHPSGENCDPVAVARCHATAGGQRANRWCSAVLERIFADDLIVGVPGMRGLTKEDLLNVSGQAVSSSIDTRY